MNAQPPPLTVQPPRRVPVVGLIGLAWIVIWLLMMWHGGWVWMRGSWMNVGAPSGGTLRLFGALVPANLRWQSFFVGPLLLTSAVSVLFLSFFWRSTGRSLVSILGSAWTYVAFVVGGAAGAAGHLYAYPDSPSIAAAGAFDPIMCGIGVQLGWGLVHRVARGLVRASLMTLLMLTLFMALMLYATGVRDFTSPHLWEAVGLVAMGTALGVGVLLAWTVSLIRRVSLDGARRIGMVLAVSLLLVVLAAVVTQALPILRAGERSAAHDFVDQLERTEAAQWKLRNQREATPALRDAFALQHSRLVSHEFLEDYEHRDVLLAYAKALGHYKQPVELPPIVEPVLRKRFRAWYDPHELALRKTWNLPPRRNTYWGER